MNGILKMKLPQCKTERYTRFYAFFLFSEIDHIKRQLGYVQGKSNQNSNRVLELMEFM